MDENKVCLNCGSKLRDNSNFCASCGTKVNNKKEVCSNCGIEIRENASFCSSCGNKVSSTIQETDNSPIVMPDYKYMVDDKKILENLIVTEIISQGMNPKTITTKDLNIKQNIAILLLGILTSIFTVMYYFNYSLIFCMVLELIVLTIYLLISEKLSLINSLKLKAFKNPDINIPNLVSEISSTNLQGKISSKLKMSIVILLSLFIPTLFFINPRILYKPYQNGYAVLRYTRGLKQSQEKMDIVIPETYKNKPVLAIGARAFKNTNIKSITLPETLKSIKASAFENCVNINKIVIPSGITEIRGSAFENCRSLYDIKLNEGLVQIRGRAFKNDKYLSDVTLPSTLEYLGGGAFYGTSIRTITIPEKVTEINGETFANCRSLREVILHDNITSIHGETFMNDTSLKEINLPSKITEIRGSTFEGCWSLEKIVIPEGVTRIGGHAFANCSMLSDVTIPSTVREIGSSAFRSCYRLYNIRVPKEAEINERAFKSSPTNIEKY